MFLPKDVHYIINTLMQNGFEAYAVGGCVRDTLLGNKPDDWDICTSALPEEVMPLFEHVIPTGITHGTVTIMLGSLPYEVTTYRIDGKYTDSRRPDSVQFTRSLTEDLLRRDFTINAMAYSPADGLCDPFSGQEDLKNKIIRCVGNADERFCEDALRILRAWRFSCKLGFEIDKNTLKSAKQHMSRLSNVSSERVCAEFIKALASTKNFARNTMADDSFLTCIIPEWTKMHMNQNNPHHIHDIAMHTLTALDVVSDSDDIIIKLAVLLHDIGKPLCYTEDENGIGHFYGHSKLSTEIAETVLRRLKFDNDTRIATVELIRYHDAVIPDNPRSVKKWLNKIGELQLMRLLEVMRSDVMGQNPVYIPERLEQIERIKEIINEILREEQCFRIKDLAISGNDLISIGFAPGKQLGKTLEKLLDAVISEQTENNRASLLSLAQKLK